MFCVCVFSRERGVKEEELEEEDENELDRQCDVGERTEVMMESDESLVATFEECAEDLCFSLWLGREIRSALESLEFETSGTTDDFCGLVYDGCVFAFKRAEGNVKRWFMESGWSVGTAGRQGEEKAVTVPEFGGDKGKVKYLLWATSDEPIGKMTETD